MNSDDARGLVEERRGSSLHLNEQELSPDVTAELAKHEGWLSLDGLNRLTDAQAERLAEHKGRLSLDKLASLTDTQAKALSRHEGDLSLDGLEELSETTAQALAGYQPTDMGDWDMLAELGTLDDHSPQEHDPNVPREEPMEQLVAHSGGVSLGGLKELSFEAAQALATCRGILSLNKLRHLPIDVAQTLATDAWGLHLDGLEQLDPGVADALAKCEGQLSLTGLTTLSAEDAVAFATREQMWVGYDDVRLDGFIAEIVNKLRRLYRRWHGCRMDGFYDLQELGHEEDILTVRAEELTAAKAELLGHVSEALWESLGSPAQSLRGLIFDPVFFPALDLDNLRSLTDEVADHLAQHRGNLWLNGLEEISANQAKALEQHAGELKLDSLKVISDEVAVSLAQHRGPLYLNGLTSLSEWQAEVFGQHQSPLELRSVNTLSYYAAKCLSRHSDDLSLLGLYDISPEVDALLRANPRIILP